MQFVTNRARVQLPPVESVTITLEPHEAKILRHYLDLASDPLYVKYPGYPRHELSNSLFLSQLLENLKTI